MLLGTCRWMSSDFEGMRPITYGNAHLILSTQLLTCSIQFAIHYMMSSIKRARRFFHTVSQLLEIGGNLIATTIDARVVMEHMMNTGYNFDFDESNDENGDSGTNSSSNEHLIVSVGNNVCQLKFHRDTVKRIFQRDGDKNGLDPNHFGLEYTFTLIEGQDHAAGVGQAVNLPEWLTPLPVLVELASEAGLKLDYAQNFHEFFSHVHSKCLCSILPSLIMERHCICNCTI